MLAGWLGEATVLYLALQRVPMLGLGRDFDRDCAGSGIGSVEDMQT